jgi:septum site-determining protein MinD
LEFLGGLFVGQTIVLVSSKGGSGKSTVAVGLSAALSVSGKSVLLIDIDEGARCLDRMLSINSQTVFDIADVLSGNADYKDAVLKVDALPNVSVIPSPYENKPLDFLKLSEFCEKVSLEFDYIILNLFTNLSRTAEHCMNISLMILKKEKNKTSIDFVYAW